MPRRKPESAITQAHNNFALAIQTSLEKIVIALATTARQLTGSKNLVMAGGVALNCVANSKIADAGLFDNIWIQPAAGDAGGALGAAYAAYHIWGGKEKKKSADFDKMQYAYLGPQYDDRDIRRVINKYHADANYFSDFNELITIVSQQIAEGKVIGWFQDRMEFGPRALGNRSILADPRNPAMQQLLNEKIKYRENFRPFAPSVLAEDASSYFDIKFPSPYMLFTAFLKEALKISFSRDEAMNMYEKLYQPRSIIPAVIHLDYSARIQTVDKEANPKFWQLIKAFKNLTECGMLINTSFNVRGEPIVCTPGDAYRCFMKTGMDYLVLGNYLFDKKKQKDLNSEPVEFKLD